MFKKLRQVLSKTELEEKIEKNGKKWGVEINGSGKVLNKYDESKEHKEKKE